MISAHRPDILTTAARYHLDPYLLEAQVWVESSDNPFAFRYESSFYTTYLKAKPFWSAWGPLAACSYGLLQILFATAVEDGFAKRPEELFVPIIGLDAGAYHLRTLLDRLKGDPSAALASYNGGLVGNQHQPYRNQGYVDRVLNFRDRLTASP